MSIFQNFKRGGANIYYRVEWRKKSYAKPHFLQTGSPFGVEMLLFFGVGVGGGEF